jgi:DHA2 family multidrug resistance protein
VIPGIAATTIAWTLVDFDEPDWGLLRRFDFVGLASMVIFLGSLEYVLEEGQKNDWFQDGAIVVLTVICLAASAVFFWRVLTAKTPIVDLKAFLDRNFAVSSLLTFVLGIGLCGLTYLYPLYLARVRGYSALQIGETVFVTGVFMFLAAPIVGNLARKVDPRLLIFAGFVGFALSSLDLGDITAGRSASCSCRRRSGACR